MKAIKSIPAPLDMSKASCGWIGFAIRSVLTMDL